METKSELDGRELDAAIARGLGLPLVQACTDANCTDHLYLPDGDGTYTDLPEFHRSLDAQREYLWPRFGGSDVFDALLACFTGCPLDDWPSHCARYLLPLLEAQAGG